MMTLTGAEIRRLKSAAQRLDPLARLGKHGLTDAFIQGVDAALTHHELVKVKFDAFKDQRKTLAPEIAARTSSRFIWMVGHVAVFYRPAADPAKRRYLARPATPPAQPPGG